MDVDLVALSNSDGMYPHSNPSIISPFTVPISVYSRLYCLFSNSSRSEVFDKRLVPFWSISVKLSHDCSDIIDATERATILNNVLIFMKVIV